MRRLAAERGRRRLRAGGGRAPRTREAGVAVRAHYEALPSMAGRGTGQGGKPYQPRPRKHGPRSEIAAVARRKALRGCSFVADGEADRVKTTLRAFRRAAPLVVARGNQSSPRAHRATRMRALGCFLHHAPNSMSISVSVMSSAARPSGSNGRLNGVKVVPLAGIEPALLAELDFESSASTNSATGAIAAAAGAGVRSGRNIAGAPLGSTGTSPAIHPSVIVSASTRCSTRDRCWLNRRMP